MSIIESREILARPQHGESPFDSWIAHNNLETAYTDDPEVTTLKLSRIMDDMEETLIQHEPGFPPGLRHIKKAPYIRGLIAEQITANEEDSRVPGKESVPVVRVGYEGLDIEIWVVKDAKVRHISFKRQGYKELNTLLSHDGADAVRDTIILTLDSMMGTIEQIALTYFEDEQELSKQLIGTCYGAILEQEREVFAEMGIDPDRPELIYSTRVAMSSAIDLKAERDRLDTELGITPDMEDEVQHRALTVERQKRILIKARRQSEIASKHMQLLSLHADSPYQDTFSMRSMVQSIPADDRALLTTYLDNRLGEGVHIPAVLHDNSDIGQYMAYDPLMEQSDSPSDNTHDIETFTQSPNFITNFFRETWPAAAQALSEVYERPIYDMHEINRKFRELGGHQAAVINAIKRNKGAKYIQENLYDFFDAASTIVADSVTKNGEFFTNDTLIKDIVGEALEKDHVLFIQSTDREGMLFLNARLGVDCVDKGLLKQAVVAQDSAAYIQQLFNRVLPGANVRVGYCLRNVDENTFAISIDPETIDTDEDHIDSYLRSALPDEIDTLTPREKVSRLCEILVAGSFTRMTHRMAAIPELKTNIQGEVFDSYASGLWFEVTPHEFASIEDVLKTADTLSEMYKRGRSSLVNRLPHELHLDVIDRQVKDYCMQHGIDRMDPENYVHVQNIQAEMERGISGATFYTRDEDGNLAVYMPYSFETGKQVNDAMNKTILNLKWMFSDEQPIMDNTDMYPVVTDGTVQNGFIKPLDMIPPLSNLRRLIKRNRAGDVITIFQSGNKALPATLGHSSPEQLADAWTQGVLTLNTFDTRTRQTNVEEFRQQTPLIRTGILYMMDHLNNKMLRKKRAS